ncbi:MAG: glycosyltransferase family 4 protein [Candidatus Woesearchaeota archaeon]
MKIAIISTYFGTDIGGAEVSTGLLVNGLKAKNEVHIIHLNNQLKWLPLSLKAFLLNTNLLDGHIERSIFKRLKCIAPDIVHIQDLMIAPAAVKATKRLNLKTIITVRDLRFVCNLPVCQNRGELYHNCNKQQYLKCLKKEAKDQFNLPVLAYLLRPLICKRSKELRTALSYADKLIAISQFVKSELEKENIKTKTEVIYNPMPDWKWRKPKPHKGSILFAPGRLEKYKGFHLLIKALKLALEKRKDIILQIAGTGSYEKQLKRLTKKLKLNNNVQFLGKLSQEEIKERYFDCDIVMFPSIWLEPLGRVPLEAMAARKPIIASDKGGIPEIVNKRNLMDFNQPSLLQNKLKNTKNIHFNQKLTLSRFIQTINKTYLAILGQ